MEGDAGASRLTPHDTHDSSSDPDVGIDESTTETATDDLSGSEDAADQQITETEDSAETSTAEVSEDPGGSSRLGRGWLVGITAALVVSALGVGVGGYLALHWHHGDGVNARNEDAAVAAAKDCVTATQAPDTTAMAASAQKIIDCSSGDYRNQAILFSSLLVEAYQVANAHVQVSDLSAAVECNNRDGAIQILVPVRVKVTNSETQNKEAGYRLRATMVLDEGKFRFKNLEQVANPDPNRAQPARCQVAR
jgi:Mce-associated membrane protein